MKSERHFSAGLVDMQPYAMDLWEQRGDIAPHALVVPHVLDRGADTIARSRQWDSESMFCNACNAHG